MNKPFKILSIDGGGIKGLYSAKVLSVFEETYNTLCSNHFDLICGTSTGGIIALAITLKIPMNEVVNFYQTYGPAIFSQKKKKWPIYDFILSIKQALFSSKYSHDQLKKALLETFGGHTIGDSQNLLCIPAYNMTVAGPRIFKRDYGTLNQDNKTKYVDIALATTAAPTYFPIVEIDDIMYADGGLYANNPTLIGLCEALYKWIKPKMDRNEDDFDGVQILSISSFEKPNGEVPGKMNRSFLNWKDTLFDSYTIGQNKSIQFFLNVVKNHLDFELDITRVINEAISADQSQISEMDNASPEAVKQLLGSGLQMGRNYKDKVKKFFETPKTVTL